MLIDREQTIEAITMELDMIDHVPQWVFERLTRAVEKVPSAEAVLKGTYEQIRWERDTALEQLKELGYSLGEKPRKGDLISREELQMQLNCVDRLQMTIDGRTIEVIPRWNVNKIIENLPTAEPNVLDDGTLTITVPHGMLSKVNRVIVDEVGTKFCKMMYQDALPSAERTGQWVCTSSDHYKCSNCGTRASYWYNEENSCEWDKDMSEWLSDYCPNCGSRNEVNE